jgi:hypothetical protein
MSKDPEDKGLWDDPLPPPTAQSLARGPGGRPIGQPLAPSRGPKAPPVKRLGPNQTSSDLEETAGDPSSDNERIQPPSPLPGGSDNEPDDPTEEGEGLMGLLPPPDEPKTVVPSEPRRAGSIPPGQLFSGGAGVRSASEERAHALIFGKKKATPVTVRYDETPVPPPVRNDQMPTGPPASQRGLEPPPVKAKISIPAGLTRFDKVLIGILLICTHTIAFMLGMKWFS